jgi:hypothetical protein
MNRDKSKNAGSRNFMSDEALEKNDLQSVLLQELIHLPDSLKSPL